MKLQRVALFLAGIGVSAAFLACGGKSSAPPAPPQDPTTRNYQATASVGDFLTITVDAAAHTIAYTNVTNGETGTVSYTVGSDGAYNITTPNGHLLKAYEIPGLALVASMDDTGPAHNTTSLVTAILKAPISMSWLTNKNFNYMQWRTNDGGIEVGWASIDASGTVAHGMFSPFCDQLTALGQGGGGTNSSAPFQSGTIPTSAFTADPSGNFLRMVDPSSPALPATQLYDTIFATQGGFFVMDLAVGSMVGVPQAATTTFDPTFAGTYNALAFGKNGAQSSSNNQETPLAGAVNTYTLTLDAAGHLTVKDAAQATVVNTTIQPVSSASYLYDGTPSKLTNTCPGLFTYRVTNGTVRQDVFLTFLSGGAILFGSFSWDTAQSAQTQATYSYLYGVALKQ